MHIFLTRRFHQWASDAGLTAQALKTAVIEIQNGLIDARLGGHLIKKRIGAGGKGKSGGVRTIVAIQTGCSAFFLYGFSKTHLGNITADELKALKALATRLLAYDRKRLKQAINENELMEVNDE